MTQENSIPIDQSIPPVTPKRLVVLVDAENASARFWSRIMELIAKTLPGRVVTAQAFFCGSHGGWDAVPGMILVDGGLPYRAKNASDFLLSYQAGQIVARDEADEIAIVSGDNGLAVLMAALREKVEAVYAFIPCSPEASAYGMALAQVADIAFLVSPPRPTVVLTADQTAFEASSPRDRGRMIAAIALRSCTPSEGGWLTLTSLGQAVSTAGISLKAVGKLTEVLRASGCFEFRNPPPHIEIRSLVSLDHGPGVAALKDAPALDRSSAGDENGIALPDQGSHAGHAP